MKSYEVKVRKRDKINTSTKVHTPKIKKEKYKFNWRKELENEVDDEKLEGLLLW
jgi:hypothetical protein